MKDLKYRSSGSQEGGRWVGPKKGYEEIMAKNSQTQQKTNLRTSANIRQGKLNVSSGHNTQSHFWKLKTKPKTKNKKRGAREKWCNHYKEKPVWITEDFS